MEITDGALERFYGDVGEADPRKRDRHGHFIKEDEEGFEHTPGLRDKYGRFI